MEQSILLVEDETALRLTLGDRLRGEGYKVDYAGDGAIGSQKATSLPFSLVILDITLPRRSGLDVCRDIRRAGLATPVLMLTARHETEDIAAGFDAGADDYLIKPFQMPELSARIEALLRRPPFGRSQHPTLSPLPKSGRLPDEFYRVAAMNSGRLAEASAQMRKTFEKEQQTPQTFHSAAFLNAAEVVIDFIEEILAGSRNPKWRR